MFWFWGYKNIWGAKVVKIYGGDMTPICEAQLSPLIVFVANPYQANNYEEAESLLDSKLSISHKGKQEETMKKAKETKETTAAAPVSAPAAQVVPEPKVVVRETYEHLFTAFTQKEMSERSDELARKTLDLETIRSRKAAVQSEYKARETEVAARLKVLSTDISNRGEERRIRCEWRLNVPKEGKKTLYRMDTLDAVREDDMTPSDRQLTLNDIETPDKSVEDKLKKAGEAVQEAADAIAEAKESE